METAKDQQVKDALKLIQITKSFEHLEIDEIAKIIAICAEGTIAHKDETQFKVNWKDIVLVKNVKGTTCIFDTEFNDILFEEYRPICWRFAPCNTLSYGKNEKLLYLPSSNPIVFTNIKMMARHFKSNYPEYLIVNFEHLPQDKIDRLKDLGIIVHEKYGAETSIYSDKDRSEWIFENYGIDM